LLIVGIYQANRVKLVYYFCTTFFEKTNIMSKFGSQSRRLAGSLLVAFALTGCGGGGGGTTPPTIAYDVPELMYYTFDGSGTSVPNLASAPVGPWASAEIEGGMTQGGLGQFSGGLIGTGGASYLDRLNTGWATDLSGDWTISLYLDNIQSAAASYVFGDFDADFRCLTGGTGGADLILKGFGIVDVVATNAAVSGPTVTHFVYDSIGGAILAYVNGVQVVPFVGQAPLTISAFPGGGPFLVGGYSPNAGLNAGSILDEFRMYNRALSAAEIAATWDQSLPVYN
jgi:hypothetical protein